MKEISKLYHAYSYEEIKEEAERLRKNFSASKLYNDEIIRKKLTQFTEYLTSLQNINKSIKDISRYDLTQLFNTLGYTINDFHDAKLSFKFDKLEIRILILASIIYRTKNEFDNAFCTLEEAYKQLMRNYRQDPEFLYFYLTIAYNRMTYYHRLDDFDMIHKLHGETLNILENEIGIQNISSYFVRVGINKHLDDKPDSREFVKVALSLLMDSDQETKVESFKKSLERQYDFLK